MDQTLSCPSCHRPTETPDFFCKACGHKLKEPPPSTTLSKQIGLYLLSFFLPPLGIIPAIKYLRQKDARSRRIGIALLLLTSISIILSVWTLKIVMDQVNAAVNTQLSIYSKY